MCVCHVCPFISPSLFISLAMSVCHVLVIIVCHLCYIFLVRFKDGIFWSLLQVVTVDSENCFWLLIMLLQFELQPLSALHIWSCQVELSPWQPRSKMRAERMNILSVNSGYYWCESSQNIDACFEKEKRKRRGREEEKHKEAKTEAGENDAKGYLCITDRTAKALLPTSNL